MYKGGGVSINHILGWTQITYILGYLILLKINKICLCPPRPISSYQIVHDQHIFSKIIIILYYFRVMVGFSHFLGQALRLGQGCRKQFVTFFQSNHRLRQFLSYLNEFSLISEHMAEANFDLLGEDLNPADFLQEENENEPEMRSLNGGRVLFWDGWVLWFIYISA